MQRGKNDVSLPADSIRAAEHCAEVAGAAVRLLIGLELEVLICWISVQHRRLMLIVI